MNKKYIILSLLTTTLFVGGYIFIYNFLNSTELTVSTKHVSSFTVTLQGSQIASTSEKTTTIRVPKYSTVYVKYIGEDGYATDSQDVAMSDSPKSITIDPFYSKERLASLLESEQSDITSAISAYQSDISKLYTIRNHTLYRFGEWASAELIWKGEYGQNTDNLHVILKKEEDTWKVVEQPSILYYYKNYPNIPIDVLRAVNNS